MNESNLRLSNVQQKAIRALAKKEEIYAKIFDAATNLLVWNNDLPKSIENLDIRLNKKDITKLQNIVWYISHSKLWK